MSDPAPNPAFSRPTYPKALQPALPFDSPGTPISLYSGQLQFTQREQTFGSEGAISLAWLPSPRIRFHVPKAGATVIPKLEDVSISLDDGTRVSRAFLTGLNHSFGEDGHGLSYSGIVAEPVVRPSDADATHALFLLPNLIQPLGKPIDYPDGSSRASRLVLEGGGWKITLDEVNQYKNTTEYLKENSGFGITQVGRLERENGEPFKAADACAILTALGWFISFAGGSWTGPCLPSGFDAQNKKVWEVWNLGRTVPYRDRQTWLDKNHGEQFEAPFAGFLKRWTDDDWQDVIRVAMHWYIEANAQAGSIEGSIVLTQTAFELLASAVLVETDGWLSNDGYEKLAAADRIRLLFLWAGIPTGLPAELADLLKVAKAENWPDTATAMTMIRNTITHPTKKNRERFGRHSSDARADAWMLGLWNLELCLLRLFDYTGSYGNRIKQRYRGEIEHVPWCRTKSS